MIPRSLVMTTLATLGLAAPASAQSSLMCPQVSSNTGFSGTTMQTDCSTGVTTGCTSKAGVTYDTSGAVLKLPINAGNFTAPASAAVPQNVYFAAPGDYDKDGWTDFVAADDTDKIYVMRNQTITCGTAATCSGSTTVAPTVQTITAAWWNATVVPATVPPTPLNKRAASFAHGTTTAGVDRPIKVGVGGSQRMTPMGAGDFDGDGWTDFIAISAAYQPSISGNASNVTAWPTAARLFMNTKNCRLTVGPAPYQPCGLGNLCTGQPTNGACTGGSVTNGTAWAETQLSCTATDKCPYYNPTFATYNLRTGAAVSAVTTTSTAPATPGAGDFGPIGHPVQQFVVLDWDGDGDLDFLYGHSGGTCPGTLCTVAGAVFYPGIDVWKNDCAQSPSWNATTKSCVGYIPRFTKSTTGTCTGTSCNNSDVLIPSTAHNTTTLAPSAGLGFDINGANGDKRVPGFAYTDIDKDGDLDLVIGSPGCCSTNVAERLRIFRGTSNSKTVHTLDTANPIVLATSSATVAYQGFQGGLTGVFVNDYSGDGWPDIITGSDAYGYSGTIGGRTRYWKHTGNAGNPFGTSWPSCSATPATCASCSATCNPAATRLISESCGSSSCATNTAASPPQYPDFDMGLQLDYDHDPTNTMDIVFTNGNTASEFYIFPNRAVASTVPACGTVTSGLLAAPTSESTVTGACITPSATFGNSTSSIKYYLSNETPANWVFACKQTQTSTPTSCCASFTNVTGKAVSWKAEFDSNSSDDLTATPCGATGTVSPAVSGITANYTYNEAAQHYRSGVVVSDGVTYVGSFRQPGNRGSFYALSAGTGAKYYDAAAKIDAQTTRYVYTANNVGTGISRINFAPTSPNATLIARVGASTATQATSVINWVLGARFGVGNISKIGAVMDSTPAILNAPFRPAWYSYLNVTEKALYDAFATTNASRITLALFASMDGMIHAVFSKATDIMNARNGEEAWAFVPPYVAASMTADYVASTTSGTTTVTSYVDGSPSLLDFKKSNGTIATAALVSDAAGGASVTALDVTNTVTSSFGTTGPTPLWSQQPGGAAAGKANSKPGVARVLIGGVETFVVVAGTGILSTDTTKGNVVGGYNLETGALLWRFELSCALTSDITILETDDETEPGPPAIDGYSDRAVFADRCGYVYKINPAASLAGGWMSNTGYGAISIGTSNGAARYALFSTTQTGALGAGQQRPIVGTIGAKSDSNSDMILFFGTGGLESVLPSLQNEFYAVRAKDGTIRNKITGTCTAGRCEKFYGGVVVTTDTVILQRSTDPVITGLVGGCDFGTSRVQFLNLSTFTQTGSLTSVGGAALTASSGPLYGDAGAIYFATVSGEIKRIGQPRATAAGGDTSTGNIHKMTTGGSAYSQPFTLMGWRVVL